MKRQLQSFGHMILLLACAVSAGCRTGHSSLYIATGAQGGQTHGISMYATENVPFEYEEIGIVRAVAWQEYGVPAESVCLDDLAKEARQRGADAIIGLRVHYAQTTANFYWMVIIEAQGVAVKIRKP